MTLPANLTGRGTGVGYTAAGFTVLELLVVLTILAAVMALAPSLMAGSGSRVRAAGQDLATNLRNLRDQAIRGHRVKDLILNDAESLYTLGTDGPSLALPDDISAQFKPSIPSLVDSPLHHIAFYPDGSSSGGTITLISDAMHIDVTVEWLNGKVSTHD